MATCPLLYLPNVSLPSGKKLNDREIIIHRDTLTLRSHV